VASKPARVLLVEDHPLVRQSVADLLKRTPDLECCGEATTIAGTASLAERLRPDLVLLDLRLGDGEAFDLIASLKQQCPALPVVVFSQSAGAVRVRRAVHAGANAYVLKGEDPETLLEALRLALAGRPFFSPALHLP